MSYYQSFEGIVLFAQNHREKDALVKIFTREGGKRMFFVRGLRQPNHLLRAALTPFTQATFVGKLNDSGLSFLRDARTIAVMRRPFHDLAVQSFATYWSHLVDAVIEDGVIQEALYTRFAQTLRAAEQGKDLFCLTVMFELFLLPLFGYAVQFSPCMLCGITPTVAFSFRDHGGVCAAHAQHRSARAFSQEVLAVMQQLAHLSVAQLGQVRLREETKQGMRQLMDAIYEEAVGIHLKSKRFVDQMALWYQ